MTKIGVCLSGCGVFDGSEIHEAALTLLALDQAGVEAVCFAPASDQAEVVDHVRQAPVPGKVRSVLTESARIARGAIRDIADINAAGLDAVIFPGGFGAAKNLSTFAVEGPACLVHPEVERLLVEMSTARKPIGAMCIAPVLLAAVLGRRGLRPRLTIGTDPGTAQALEAMGAVHQPCAAEDCVVDEEHRIVTTPAYMLGRGPAEIFEGIGKLVDEILRWMGD